MQARQTHLAHTKLDFRQFHPPLVGPIVVGGKLPRLRPIELLVGLLRLVFDDEVGRRRLLQVRCREVS